MSKLDDAFLKAYGKVRSSATRGDSGIVAADSAAPPQDTDRIGDDNHQGQVRPDNGVVNVASFIARTATGRSRGTALPPGDGVPPANLSNPPLDPCSRVAAMQNTMQYPADGQVHLIDTAHALRGVHFQPVTVDLAAFDQFAPQMAAARSESSSEWVAGAAHGPAVSAAFGAMTSSPPVADAPMAPAPTPRSAPATRSAPAPRSAPDLSESAPPVLRSGSGSGRPNSTEATQEHPPQLYASGAESPSIETPSSEAVPSEPPSFQAAWEVDQFEFEAVIWELSVESSPLWQAAEQLQAACAEGLRVLAVTSPGRGQGRSTLAITLARMLAAQGLGVALVDGDVDRPSLADKLSLDIRLGWGDSVRAGLSPEEVAVHSVEDGFTVLPLAAPETTTGVRPPAAATTRMLDGLSQVFDLIIIDTANVNVVGGWIPGTDAPCQIDAALVIQDLRCDDPDAMQACLRRLNKLQIANVGLVENFASEQAEN